MCKWWKLEYLTGNSWVGCHSGYGGCALFETEQDARTALAMNAFGLYSHVEKWRILDPKGRAIQL